MVDPDQFAEIVVSAIETATAPLLARIVALEGRTSAEPKDGRDGIDGKDADPSIIEGLRAEIVELRLELATAKASVPNLSGLVDAAVARAIAVMPTPKDGIHGRDGTDGKDGAPGSDGRHGVDGLKGVDGIHGRDGTDGKPGDQGRDGRDGQMGVPGRDGEKGLDGKDGQDGQDGRHGIDGKDGLGFDDFEETIEDGGRFLVRTYRQGDRVKTCRHQTATPIFRGVYRSGQEYQPGDVTTRGGSMWHCDEATKTAPADFGEGGRKWTLCVKEGRMGREGKIGPQGEKGAKGDRGDR